MKIGEQIKGKRLLLFLLVCIFFYFVFEVWSSYKCLSVEYFSMQSSKVDQPIKLVVLSDLHDASFGRQNEKLIDEISKQNPDLIFMVGDMLNRDSADSGEITGLVKNLSDVADIFYALGNHEYEYIKKKGTGLVKELEDAGATVLDGEYRDLVINNTPVRIGAMYPYVIQGDMSDESYEQTEGYQFMTECQSTDKLTLFLTHRPEAFLWSQNVKKENWKIDGVFSGHVHGGQVVLPFLGGLYGAEQGWFPPYADGKYLVGESQFFVTRGLGSNFQVLPRVWNRPQIMVVEVE